MLTGDFIDAAGVRRGFSGDIIVEAPEAVATYAGFVNAEGSIVGSYVDAEGTYRAYARTLDGRFVSLDIPWEADLDAFFVHGINDARIVVARVKEVGDVMRTYVGTYYTLQEVRFPGSVSTEGWNINQDGSVVGNYELPDGRRHGFIARPVGDTAAETVVEPVTPPTEFNYTFETIDVPGVDFLALTASSDFEDYAGNTRSSDGQKMVGFTLIDGVFRTYDFPNSQNTFFYALGNNGQAAGHYEDMDGLFHGVILENGELRQYDFPGAVETFIHGISDATGVLTGSFIDAAGVRRGFSGDLIVEAPEAVATYADFVNAEGAIVGSYIDTEGIYRTYTRAPDGRFISLDIPGGSSNPDYLFIHGVNDSRVAVGRAKAAGDVPRTYVGTYANIQELYFPGSVSTEGWNINQDGSVVGYYDSPDGRRHGFIARPTSRAESENYSNAYTVRLAQGLNMISVPLVSPTPMTAKSLVAVTGATIIVALDASKQRFIAWTPSAPDAGFAIEGGQGYIVNVPQARNFAFVGAPWADQEENAAAAPAAISTERLQETWAFVVSGHLAGQSVFDGYQVIVRNLRTDNTITTSVRGGYFAAATADLSRRSVVQVGDVIEVRVVGPGGNTESQPRSFKVTPGNIADAVLFLQLDDVGQPTQNLLLPNYPNPFNPETWIPYQLSEAASVSISIYDSGGKLIRSLSIGYQSAGFYTSRSRAVYWDGKNSLGEPVASGIYFYTLTADNFTATRKMLIRK